MNQLFRLLLPSSHKLKHLFFKVFCMWDHESLKTIKTEYDNRLCDAKHIPDTEISIKYVTIAKEHYHSSLDFHNNKVIDIIYENLEAFKKGYEKENIEYERYTKIIEYVDLMKPFGSSGIDKIKSWKHVLRFYTNIPKE